MKRLKNIKTKVKKRNKKKIKRKVFKYEEKKNLKDI